MNKCISNRMFWPIYIDTFFQFFSFLFVSFFFSILLFPISISRSIVSCLRMVFGFVSIRSVWIRLKADHTLECVTCPFIDKKLIRWKQNYNHSIRLWHVYCAHTHIHIYVCITLFECAPSYPIFAVYVFDEIAAAHDNNIFVNVIACELVHLQLS